MYQSNPALYTNIFSNGCEKAGLEVFTAASMKMTVFWVVALCSLVEFADVSEVLATSNIRASVNFYQTIQRYNPEDSHLRI
jgi:hypothetical protein